MDFLWHKVSKEEQEDIKREAKKIIDNFADSLKNIEKTDSEIVERPQQLREETEIEKDDSFRKLFFNNMPKKSGDWLKAERGKWKQ